MGLVDGRGVSAIVEEGNNLNVAIIRTATESCVMLKGENILFLQRKVGATLLTPKLPDHIATCAIDFQHSCQVTS